jgi:hypothetical protein
MINILMVINILILGAVAFLVYQLCCLIREE